MWDSPKRSTCQDDPYQASSYESLLGLYYVRAVSNNPRTCHYSLTEHRRSLRAPPSTIGDGELLSDRMCYIMPTYPPRTSRENQCASISGKPSERELWIKHWIETSWLSWDHTLAFPTVYSVVSFSLELFLREKFQPAVCITLGQCRPQRDSL